MSNLAMFRGGRISRALFVLPMILGLGALALAGTGGGILPLPPWQLKADGKQAIVARAGDLITFTVRGQYLPGATAFLTINHEGVMEILPIIRSDKNLPLVVRFQLPGTAKAPRSIEAFAPGHVLANETYTVGVIGRTSSGFPMASNTVTVHLAK